MAKSTKSRRKSEVSVRLNPELDREACRESFGRDRRVHIRDVLAYESAQRILECLESEVTWNLVFNEGLKHHDLRPNQLAAMSPKQEATIMAHVNQGARDGFQYLYHSYPMYDSYRDGNDPGHYLHTVHEFINSEPMLDFVRAVTGFDDIAYADSQATLYGPGHFLTRHNDDVEGKSRRCAYIFNFTPRWRPDWGGLLEFVDADGHVSGGLVPSFNALNLLAVPFDHYVSYVAPYAGGKRYSITGWFRYR